MYYIYKYVFLYTCVHTQVLAKIPDNKKKMLVNALSNRLVYFSCYIPIYSLFLNNGMFTHVMGWSEFT